MSLYVRFTSLIRNLFRKERVDRDLDAELRAYIDQLMQEKIEAGMPPEKARREACLELGGIEQVKDEVRDVRAGRWLDTVAHDLRYGLRMLRKNPAFTVIAVTTLALGIGATTTVISIVNSILFRSMSYQDPDRLAIVVMTRADQNLMRTPFSVADFLDWRAQNTVFEGVAAYTNTTFTLSGDEGPEQVVGASVTAEFFSILGINAEIGRTFVAEEVRPGSPARVVISHSLWQRRLRGDPSIIGRSLNLNGAAYTVVGVMPPAFSFPRRTTDIWRSSVLNPPPRRGPYAHWVVARLRSGVTLDTANVELKRIAQSIAGLNPKENANAGLHATDMREYFVGDVRRPLYVLLAAVGFVLLITSVNVANLLLTRAIAREQELAVRAALGASRQRLVRQLFAESLLLAAIGAVIGVAVTYWGLGAVRTLLPPSTPRVDEIAIDARVLLFAIFIAVFSGVLFGVAPAWHTARASMSSALTVRGTDHRHWLRRLFVMTELALSLVLLITAGLMLKSFVRLQNVQPGFETQNVLALRINPSRVKYPNDQRLVQLHDSLVSRIGALPGVNAAGFANSLPPDLLELTDSFTVEGKPLPEGQYPPIGPVLFVSSGYFDALQIPVLRGRNFGSQDVIGAPRVTIVNDALARHYFPNEDPIGRRIKIGGAERPNAPWMEIIGVVGDVRYSGMHRSAEPTYYEPVTQVPWFGLHLVVKASTEPDAVLSGVKQVIAELDKDLPISDVGTMEEAVSESLGQPRFRTLVVGGFAAIALMLAAIGVYGVMSYSVGLRVREIAIRMSLGARRVEVLGMVLRETLVLVGAGISAGLIGAFLVTSSLQTILFDVAPNDPMTFITVSAFLVFVALMACVVPARRATSVDPMTALRYV